MSQQLHAKLFITTTNLHSIIARRAIGKLEYVTFRTISKMDINTNIYRYEYFTECCKQNTSLMYDEMCDVPGGDFRGVQCYV